MTDILDRVSDLAIAPLTNTPLTSTDTTFEIAQLAADITTFADPGSIGYYAWVWDRTNYPNVGDAQRAGFAERVRVTARNVGPQTLTVIRGASPIDLNVVGVDYWLVASMNAELIEQIDDRIFDFAGGNLVTTKRVDMPSAEINDLDLIGTTPAVGSLNFFEDTANGPEAVTLQAPAGPLAGSFAMTLISVLPGGLEFLTIDAAGLMGTSPATLIVPLDDAYNAGGLGLGRIITAVNGPVEIQGADGLQLSTAAPQLLWETAGAVYNWRHLASAVDTMLFQRGDQDADVSDDAFVNMLALAGVTRRAGINTGSPQDTLHVLEITGASRLRLQTSVDEDSSILLQNVGAPTWEFGYDTSENAFILGRLSFTNPVFAVLDTTGRIGVNTLTPGTSRMYVRTTGEETGLTLNTQTNSTMPCLDFISDVVSLHDHGDIRLSQRQANAINPDSGEFWYNHGTNRRFEFAAGNARGAIAGCLVSNDRAQRQITVGGVLNAVGSIGHIYVEGQAAADDLDTITAESLASGAYFDGDIVVLSPFTGHTITVRHGVGNIRLDGGTNKVLVNENRLELQYNGFSNNWYQLTTMMVLT